MKLNKDQFDTFRFTESAQRLRKPAERSAPSGFARLERLMSDRPGSYVGSVLFSPFLFGPYKRKKRASARFFKSECVFESVNITDSLY